MSDPEDPTKEPDAEGKPPQEPPPPFRPNPDLIGDMERGQKGAAERR